jgi:hypothetical protein
VAIESLAGGAADDVIRKMRAPRTFNRIALAKAVGSFRGTHFDLYVNTDPDSIHLMNMFDAVLTSASVGWLRDKPVDKNIGILVGQKAVPYAYEGIAVAIPEANATSFESPATALAKAISREGLDVAIFKQPTLTKSADGTFETNPNTLHLFIGSK